MPIDVAEELDKLLIGLKLVAKQFVIAITPCGEIIKPFIATKKIASTIKRQCEAATLCNVNRTLQYISSYQQQPSVPKRILPQLLGNQTFSFATGNC